MPATFPSPLLAHQGLVVPLVRKWPQHFDALALFIGAAMPDVIDILFGFVTGSFIQWYGHSLMGVVLLDIPGGLLLTWLVMMVIQFPKRWNPAGQVMSKFWPGIWIFSLIVGAVSHLAFDLISHEANLLLYPWIESARWFPAWWYTTWYRIPLAPMFGGSYSLGPHSLIWGILTVVGAYWFYQYIFQVMNEQKESREHRNRKTAVFGS